MPDPTYATTRTAEGQRPPQAQNHVAGVVAATLASAGVRAAIGLDDPQPLFASLRDSPLQTVLVHDERSGAFMADGYARATGRPALCGAVAGPGATNLATGLLEALRASSPTVAVVGEPTPGRPGVRGFQGMPHEALLRLVCKGVIRIEEPAQASRAVHHAVDLARTGRPGPVALVAANALWHEPATEAAVGRDRAHSIALGPDAGLQEAAATLRRARRPMIVAGGGAVIAGARDGVTRLAEATRIPVATTLLGKGAIDETHPLAAGVVSAYTSGVSGSGRAATRFLADADVVLVIGSDLDPVTTSGGAWPSDAASLIRIDIDPAELTTFQGLQLLGDARTVTEALVHVIVTTAADGDDPERLAWLRAVSAAKAEQRALAAERDTAAEENGVWPGAVAVEIGRHLAGGDALVTDASYSSAWALDRIVQTRAERTVIAPRGSGVLGWGLPAALGVKLGRPGDRVTCLTGDGGLYFSLGELESAVRIGLPIVLVLLNNRSYGFQWHADRHRLGRDHADLHFGEHVDYDALASAFGWEAVSVAHLSEFSAAYADARSADGPTFIDVQVDREAFPPLAEFDVETDPKGLP